MQRPLAPDLRAVPDCNGIGARALPVPLEPAAHAGGIAPRAQ